jgi:tetratricopeptide (TPR) repeat protein
LSAYEVRRIDDLEKIPVSDADINWRPIGRALGIRAFGINAYTADEGTHVVEEHTETQLEHEEVYVVLSGRARFILGDDEVEVKAGAFVFVRDPQTKRGAVALEDGTTVLAVGGKPGEAYEVSPWESYFAAVPLSAAGDHKGAAALIRAELERSPDNPSVLYNLACAECLAGDTEAALEQLTRAVELNPKTAEWAREDTDFDAIRDEPRFVATVGGPA